MAGFQNLIYIIFAKDNKAMKKLLDHSLKVFDRENQRKNLKVLNIHGMLQGVEKFILFSLVWNNEIYTRTTEVVIYQ